MWLPLLLVLVRRLAEGRSVSRRHRHRRRRLGRRQPPTLDTADETRSPATGATLIDAGAPATLQ